MRLRLDNDAGPWNACGEYRPAAAGHGVMMPLSPFSERAVAAIRAIPRGMVATYGQMAALAGNRRAARQIARLLHSSSRAHLLPWYRVVGCGGRISLPGVDGDRQRALLKKEGVRFTPAGTVDMAAHQWAPPLPPAAPDRA
ncbi:MAG: MGMT family protein [Pseudodesulfovibrio sp.]